MRKIREVLRQWLVLGLSYRQISRSCQLGRGTVGEYVVRAKAAGLSWDQVKDMDDAGLEELLSGSALVTDVEEEEVRWVPDWAEVHKELRRKGVTRALLWEEYREAHPKGYSYSQYCELFRQFTKTLDVWMRQDHKAGEKLFVDFAGQTVDIVDRATGEARGTELFVATLGASNFTYAEATASQELVEWIGAHVRALEYLGGAPDLVVPDNLKSGVKTPCRYEPEVNPTYTEMAEHYGMGVLPARSRKPRDKAKVENAVLHAERWILARLRNRTFFSLKELNEAIAVLLEELNDRPMKQVGASRRELYESLDRPALRPLPENRYEFAKWKKVRVGPDYHVEFEGHYYSVPYQLLRQQLDLRATQHTVEIFGKSKRVAVHRRDRRVGRHTTVVAHMPKAHQAHVEWTPVRLVKWARTSGEATAELVEGILSSRAHPQQGFRASLGVMRLGKKYGQARLEAACRRAVAIQSYSYRSVHSILKRGLEQQPLPGEQSSAPVEHDNVRGAGYYASVEADEVTPC